MKTLRMFIFFVAIALFALPVNSLAQGTDWVLYDDFSSGAIDPAKWGTDSGGAPTLVDGQARLECPAGVRKIDLFFANPTEIAAIRAKVTIESATEDVRAGIVGFLGNLGENPIWFGNELRPYKSDGASWACGLSVLTPSPDYDWLGDIYWGYATYPGIAVGQSYVVTFYADRAAPLFSVDGQGSMARTLATPLTESTEPSLALRARNYTTSSGEYTGSVTVLFDDVYVIYRTGE